MANNFSDIIEEYEPKAPTKADGGFRRRSAEELSAERERALSEYSPSIGAFSPLGPRTPEAQALDALAANAAFVAVPGLLAEALGYDGRERLSEARDITGAYGTAAEAIGLLPSSLMLGGGSLARQMFTGTAYGGGTSFALAGPENVGMTTVHGAGLGAVAPPLVKGAFAVPGMVSPVLRNVSDSLFLSPAKRAEKRILRELAKTDETPASLMAQAGREEPITLAEITGGEAYVGTQPLVTQATSETGMAAKLAAEQLGERTAGAGERVAAVASSDLPKGNASEVASVIRETQKQGSNKLYSIALDDFVPDENVVSTLSSVLKRFPDLVKPFKEAKNSIHNTPKLDIQIPKTKTVLINGTKKEVPTELKDLSPRAFNYVLDNMKKQLDAQIQSAIKKKDWGKVSQLTQLKDEFISVLDDVNPDYKTAREFFSGEQALMNALDIGRSVFKNKLTLENIQTFMKNATPSEKEHFRLGVSTFIQDQLESGSISSVKGLLSKDFQSRLKAAWPDIDSFNKFVSTVKTEIGMAEGASRMTPSPSVAQEEGVFRTAVSAPVAGRVVGGRTASGLAVGLGDIIRRLQGKMDPQEALEVTKMLLSSTPDERMATLLRLENSGKINRNMFTDILSGLGSIGRFSADQIERLFADMPGVVTTPSVVGITD